MKHWTHPFTHSDRLFAVATVTELGDDLLNIIVTANEGAASDGRLASGPCPGPRRWLRGGPRTCWAAGVKVTKATPSRWLGGRNVEP